MKLRYAGTCRVCEAELPARSEAIYERDTKTVRCVSHDEPQPVEPPDPGAPGASARREFERINAPVDAPVDAMPAEPALRPTPFAAKVLAERAEAGVP